jgi:Tfp pilus assembly protein PilX
MFMVQTKSPASRSQQQGFALLMTLIVVTVVLAIGITVLDVSTKQLRLSTNAKDSEIAFQAANAGMECARYIRRDAADDIENGLAISPAPTCFRASPYSNTRSQITDTVSGDGVVYKYDYSFSWVSGTRCSEITTLVASSTASGSGLIIDDMTTLIPGYPTSQKACAAGEVCTVLSVRGYNKGCSTSYGYGTVEREVLLQF